MRNEEFQDLDSKHSENSDFVTVYIADQVFGIPVHLIHDVFTPDSITQVPLSGPEIGGVLNLRGRIVTAIDVRQRLGLSPRDLNTKCMAVGIEKNGESYGLIIDRVGEVLSLSNSEFERNPANLDTRWRAVSKGIYRLESELLVIFDVEYVLDMTSENAAA
jgi:purine-binding chemotaxis protein CheW